MENETKELLVEENGVTSPEVNRKSSKATFWGIAAVTTAVLLLKFRKKIGAKIENVMAKRLGKKGYAILSPTEMEEEIPNIVAENIE